MQRKLYVLLFLVLLLIAGIWFADRKLKGHGHPGLPTFLQQWWVNYPASFAVEPMVVSITVEQADIDALEAVVQAARERGVIMPEGNEYVPAILEFNGQKIKTKVRIKGKMSDHVQGSKWSFRVLTKKDDGFLGMQRFSLQHPGTRNYLCDWFYHQLSQGEGIIALRYGFLHVNFNGEDLGVYAYEEHFGPELLVNNGRLNGPLFRFDPSLFWEHRLNMMNKVRYHEAFGAYEAAAVDGFGTGSLAKDSVQRRYFEEAVGLMDSFRRGERKASEVFDSDLIARRHALLDLVGGHHSMDWSDVKFYFDPVLKRVEPISYESFSAYPIKELAGTGKYSGKRSSWMDLHTAYFNDPEIFRAYVHHLERMSSPTYLDSAFTKLAPALDSASALIYREFPYKELDRSIYYKNGALIRRMLDVPKGFHAYYDGGVDTVNMTVIPIESLPIEIHGLIDKDGTILPPISDQNRDLQATIVPSRIGGEVGKPMTVRVPINGKLDLTAGVPLRISYSVLGASIRKELEVFPYAYLDKIQLPLVTGTNTTDLRNISYLQVDDQEKTITILPGNWTLGSDLYLPNGYTIMATAPLRLDFVNGARLISRSPMLWSGVEDLPIVLHSSDQSGGGLIVLSSRGSSSFYRVRFEGFGSSRIGTPSIVLQDADVHLKECDLGEARGRDLLLAVRSKIGMEDVSFTGGMDQLTLAYCTTTMEKVGGLGAGDDALSVKGGSAVISALRVEGAMGTGVKLDEYAIVELVDPMITSKADAARVSEGATLKAKGGSFTSEKEQALDVEPEHDRHGPSQVELDSVKTNAPTQPYQIGKGNTVLINGMEMEPTLSTKAP